MGKYHTGSADETICLGKKLGSLLKGGETIAFQGGMGTGKTTFCRGLAKGLGITELVCSPTFALLNYYHGRIPLAHLDAYRLEQDEDLEATGFYEYQQQGAVLAVEWSENISDLLDSSSIIVNIQALPDNQRMITIEGVPNL